MVFVASFFYQFGVGQDDFLHLRHLSLKDTPIHQMTCNLLLEQAGVCLLLAGQGWMIDVALSFVQPLSTQ